LRMTSPGDKVTVNQRRNMQCTAAVITSAVKYSRMAAL